MVVRVMGSEKQVKMCVGTYSQHKTSLVAKSKGIGSKCSDEHHYWLRVSVEASACSLDSKMIF